jgi:hypothetical protein
MKTLRVLLLISVFLPFSSHGQSEDKINEIKARFAEWQPIVKVELEEAPVVYLYAWGENYANEEWTTQEIKSDEKTLSETHAVIRNKTGSFVYSQIHSFSGDWFTVSENYYDKSGKLFFVFWSMNTFHAEEPVTVEKRLYFDETGKAIKSLQNVYKMNTKEKTDVSFMDQDVAYKTDFEDLPFKKYLPKE